MSAPVAFRRLDHSGREVDGMWVPIDAAACHMIAPVWVGAMVKGEYAGIWLLLENGQEVFVTRKPAKVLEFPGITAAIPSRRGCELSIEPDGSASLVWLDSDARYHLVIDTMEPRLEAGDAV